MKLLNFTVYLASGETESRTIHAPGSRRQKAGSRLRRPHGWWLSQLLDPPLAH
jgi:hypothetical protein